MDKPLRVLQINAISRDFGGVSKFVYEVYKRIDKEKIQFDVLSPKKTTYEVCRNEMEEMGANIYELGIDEQKRGLRFYIELLFKTLKFFNNYHYSIVHINSGIINFNLIIALAAKIKGIKKIIVHSHGAKFYTNKIKRYIVNIEKVMIQYLATDYFACSGLAAESMFPKKIIKLNKIKIINNGIEIEKFKFNPSVREEYRKELGLDGKFVIGHIGRFSEEKNHEYLIDIFKEINKSNKNAILLLVGEGDLAEEIKNKVKRYNLTDNVIFLGFRKDIPQLMQAMDVFVFPSKREGLGLVLIEAQAASLPIVASDVIPLETNITEYIYYLSLKESPTRWAEEINKWNKDYIRNNTLKKIENAGFDINNTCKTLEEIYINYSKEEK